MEQNLNTEHVDEATEVKEASGLHAALAEATEHKPEVENTEGWNFSDPEPTGEENTDPKPSTEDPDKKTKGTTGKVSDEVKKASAETATLMFDEILQLSGNFAVNQKFKKKLSIEEKRRVLEKDLEDAKIEDLEDEDQLLKKKFDRLLKQRDRKLKNIPLDADEKKRCFTSFYNYFKVKDIAMPPEWLLGFTLTTIFIDRTIEVVAD